jgi:hypothetical protein
VRAFRVKAVGEPDSYLMCTTTNADQRGWATLGDERMIKQFDLTAKSGSRHIPHGVQLSPVVVG